MALILDTTAQITEDSSLGKAYIPACACGWTKL